MSYSNFERLSYENLRYHFDTYAAGFGARVVSIRSDGPQHGDSHWEGEPTANVVVSYRGQFFVLKLSAEQSQPVMISLLRLFYSHLPVKLSEIDKAIDTALAPPDKKAALKSKPELPPVLVHSLKGLRDFVFNRPNKGRPAKNCTDATLVRWVTRELKATELLKRRDQKARAKVP